MGCTNEDSASANSACKLDCTLKTGVGLKFSDC